MLLHAHDAGRRADEDMGESCPHRFRVCSGKRRMAADFRLKRKRLWNAGRRGAFQYSADSSSERNSGSAGESHRGLSWRSRTLNRYVHGCSMFVKGPVIAYRPRTGLFLWMLIRGTEKRRSCLLPFPGDRLRRCSSLTPVQQPGIGPGARKAVALLLA